LEGVHTLHEGIRTRNEYSGHKVLLKLIMKELLKMERINQSDEKS